MDGLVDGNDLVERTERMLHLMKTLNLENSAKITDFLAGFCPLVEDLKRVKSSVCELKSILARYGVDSPTENSLILKMEVMAPWTGFMNSAALAYCALKSQLFLRQNDFFDEIVWKVDCRLKSASEEVTERLMQVVIQIKDSYGNIL